MSAVIQQVVLREGFFLPASYFWDPPELFDVPTGSPFLSLSSILLEDETGLFSCCFVNRHLGSFWLGSTLHMAAKNVLRRGFLHG